MVSAPKISVFKGLVTHLQFVSLLSKLSLPWPNEFAKVLAIAEYFNLDARSLIGDIDLPVLDFRLLFVIVANIIPAALIVLSLLLFQPVLVVVWYLLTVGSFAVCGAGLFMYFRNGDDAGIWVSAAGGLAALILVIVGGTAYLIRHSDTAGKDEKQLAADRKVKELRLNTPKLLALVLLVLGSAVMGCIFLGSIPTGMPRGAVEVVAGWCLLVFAALLCIYVAVYLRQSGRQKLAAAKGKITSWLLVCVITLVDVTIVPVLTYCVSSFLCQTYRCNAGSKFSPFNYRHSDSYSNSATIFCDNCEFRDATCALTPSVNRTNVEQLCPAYSSRRLVTAPGTSCEHPDHQYFAASSMLVLFTYGVMIPMMYLFVIRKTAEMIWDHIQVIPKDRTDDVSRFEDPRFRHDSKVQAEKFRRQCEEISPAASGLYERFNWKHRFYVLGEMYYAIVIALLMTSTTPYSDEAAVYGQLCVHAVMALVVVAARPYRDRLCGFVGGATPVIHTLNAAFCVALLQGVAMPQSITIALLVWNGLVVLLAVVLFVHMYRVHHNSKEQVDKRKRRKEEEEQRAKQEKKGEGEEELELVVDSTAGRATTPSQQQRQNNVVGASQQHGSSAEPLLALPLREQRNEEEEEGEEEGDAAHPRRNPIRSTIQFTSIGDVNKDDIDHLGALSRTLSGGEQMLRSHEKALSKIKLQRHRSVTITQEDRIKRNNDTWSRETNLAVEHVMSRYFMIMGVLLIVALGASFLGFNSTRESLTYVRGSSSLHRSSRYVLANYNNWTDVPDNCCCIVSRNPGVAFNITERWLCRNGVTMDRGRRSHDLVDNGLPLRDVCGAALNFGCEVGGSSATVQLTCPVSPQGVTQRAQDLFW